MTRLFVALLGLVVALLPGRVIRLFEALAIRDPGAASRRASSVTAARTEGIAYLLAALLGGRALAWVHKLLGLAGLIAILAPRRALALNAQVMYANPDAVEWRPQATRLVRTVGLVYVAQAILAHVRKR